MVSDWPLWIERRVESIAFKDQGTFVRRVSVDFVAPALTSPLLRATGEEVQLIPLTMLRKRRLVAFDLRLEGGIPASLLSRRHVGPLTAGMLLFALRAWIPSERGRPIPFPVLHQIWSIATGGSAEAMVSYFSLGTTARGGDADELAWRKAIIASPEFLAFARDLSENFLVLTPMTDVVGRRRVVKMQYEEAARLPDDLEISRRQWTSSLLRRIEARLPAQKHGQR